MGKITKQAIRQSKSDKSVLAPLSSSSCPSSPLSYSPNVFFSSPPLSHLLFQPRFSSSPLSSSLTYARLAPPSSSPSSSSSSSPLVLLFLLPSVPPFLFPPLSGGAALHARPLPSPPPLIQPLIRSIHYSIHRDMIR